MLRLHILGDIGLRRARTSSENIDIIHFSRLTGGIWWVLVFVSFLALPSPCVCSVEDRWKLHLNSTSGSTSLFSFFFFCCF